tara:strand:+ start:4154 stop:4735 length:582 start_codon:yes stop_codon:yes gene_type:complete
MEYSVSTLKTNTIQAATGSTINVASGQVLNAPGHVIQVQYTQYTGTFTQSYTAETDAVIGAVALSVNITPKSTSSIIKLDAHIFHEFSAVNTQDNHVWFFYRDTTALKAPSAGSRPCGISMSSINSSTDAGSTPEIANYTYFDTPNTTSQITYKIGLLTRFSGTLYVNRTVNDNDNNAHERGISFTSATEIAQ